MVPINLSRSLILTIPTLVVSKVQLGASRRTSTLNGCKPPTPHRNHMLQIPLYCDNEHFIRSQPPFALFEYCTVVNFHGCITVYQRSSANARAVASDGTFCLHSVLYALCGKVSLANVVSPLQGVLFSLFLPCIYKKI